MTTTIDSSSLPQELNNISQNMRDLLDDLKNQVNLAISYTEKSSELLIKIYNQGKEDNLSKDVIRGLVVSTLKTVKGLKDRQIRNLLPLELKYSEFANVGGNITAYGETEPKRGEERYWMSRICMHGRIVASQWSGNGLLLCLLCLRDEEDYPGISKTVRPMYANHEISEHVLFDHGIILHGWGEYESLPACSPANSPNGCGCVVKDFKPVSYESKIMKISDIKLESAT
jgi:hypothetical protein